MIQSSVFAPLQSLQLAVSIQALTVFLFLQSMAGYSVLLLMMLVPMAWPQHPGYRYGESPPRYTRLPRPGLPQPGDLPPYRVQPRSPRYRWEWAAEDAPPPYTFRLSPRAARFTLSKKISKQNYLNIQKRVEEMQAIRRDMPAIRRGEESDSMEPAAHKLFAEEPEQFQARLFETADNVEVNLGTIKEIPEDFQVVHENYPFGYREELVGEDLSGIDYDSEGDLERLNSELDELEDFDLRQVQGCCTIS